MGDFFENVKTKMNKILFEQDEEMNEIYDESAEVENDVYADEYAGYGEESFVNSGLYTSEEETVVEQPKAQAQAYTTPVAQAAATVIMLSPYDIRTSQVVVDHIRQGHIVICNLTSSQNNQRVVDFISGGLYAFDGKIEPTPVKTTFVCTPSNVNLIVPTTEEAGASKVSAL